MKWIFLSLFILTHSPLWAAEQYTKTKCDQLKQQKEQVRKRLNAGYGFAEGERLDKQDRELFQKIAAHCTSPVTDTSLDEAPSDGAGDEQETSQNRRPTPSKYADVSLQQMPAWSGRNAIFKGDKAAAWTEFYQVPRHCRQKELSEVEFVRCADHKSQQRQLFEQKWQRLKFSPLNINSAQAMPSQAQRQPIQNVVTAYTVEPKTSAKAPAAQPSASRYVENIQQQFNWVGMAIIGILAALSWLIWRKL
ncbi:hypothetical protein EOE67_02050 [Rheinheimera riviphila]|uniref:Uncharacterized protein n=1 Tax=Rheinheimera riviphila TaxID=1834037 RepID=A0A437R5D3_9GAMM|nr:hypothetical protein [Rheinheimera riviphila]RVU41990.1 hypothetical protein EOE67_02050 [Rheinheimera riviphila]